MLDMEDAALELDDSFDLNVPRERAVRLRAIAREARRHGYTARVVAGAHVLVTSSDGACLATRSAARLAAWMGY